MGRKITKPSYGKRKRIVTENDEEKEQITSLVRNLNDHLSQRGHNRLQHMRRAIAQACLHTHPKPQRHGILHTYKKIFQKCRVSHISLQKVF